jgi:hypothetical protein
VRFLEDWKATGPDRSIVLAHQRSQPDHKKATSRKPDSKVPKYRGNRNVRRVKFKTILGESVKLLEAHSDSLRRKVIEQVRCRQGIMNASESDWLGCILTFIITFELESDLGSRK